MCGPPPSLSSKNIYVQNPNVRWDDIIGLEDAKRLVKEAVVYPIKVRRLREASRYFGAFDSEYISFKGLKGAGGGGGVEGGTMSALTLNL